MITTSLPILLHPGTYTLKAVLVTNGKVVASSAEAVVSVTSPLVSPVTTSPSTSAEALTKACDAQPPTTSNGTQGLRPGTITLFCKGLPADSLVSWLMMGPGGDLWFTEGPPGQGWPGNGIGRITPSGVITVFTRGLSAGNWVGGGLMAGPGGDLWFTEGPGIGRITPSGVITLFTNGLPAGNSVGRSSLNFSSASSLVVGPDGDLWFTVFNNNGGQPAIGRITPSGVINLFTKGLPPANAVISSLIADRGGNLWFTVSPTGSSGQPAIGRITPSGVITMFTKSLPANANSYISGLMTGPDGNLWFTDASSIGRITPSGIITLFTNGLPAGSEPYGLMAGPGGDLWFTAGPPFEGGTGIGRITPSGRITMVTMGLSADSWVNNLVAGPGGDLWANVEWPTNTSPTLGIGRITP